MNPYFYLFYRLSRFLNRSGKNEMAPIYAITILVGMNVSLLYVRHSEFRSGVSKGRIRRLSS